MKKFPFLSHLFPTPGPQACWFFFCLPLQTSPWTKPLSHEQQWSLWASWPQTSRLPTLEAEVAFQITNLVVLLPSFRPVKVLHGSSGEDQTRGLWGLAPGVCALASPMLHLTQLQPHWLLPSQVRTFAVSSAWNVLFPFHLVNTWLPFRLRKDHFFREASLTPQTGSWHHSLLW